MSRPATSRLDDEFRVSSLPAVEERVETSAKEKPMPAPTPNLTAEIKELLSDLFDRPITDDDMVGLRLLGVVESHVADATRKAFEEAAEKARQMLAAEQYGAIPAAILALAKEQPSTET